MATEGLLDFQGTLHLMLETAKDPDIPLHHRAGFAIAAAISASPGKEESLLQLAKYIYADSLNAGTIALLENRREEFGAWLAGHFGAVEAVLRAAGASGWRTLDDLAAQVDRALAGAGAIPQGQPLEPSVRDIYTRIGDIGEGAKARVYLAQSKEDRASYVALRTPKAPDTPLATEETARRLLRFRETAQQWQGLAHANIVPVYKWGMRPYPWMAMEYMEGGSLYSRLKDRTLQPDRALGTAIQIADALAYAHRRGVWHADLKPGNIMFTLTDVPKVADWGSARGPLLTAPPASVPGTAPYLAPEQLAGDDADAQTDVFQMGVVLYELFAGRYPWTDSGVVPETVSRNVLDRIQRPDFAPPPLSRYLPFAPQDLNDIVMKAMSKDRAARYADGGALHEALVGFARGAARRG